jgi:hypothetical protein
MRPVSVLHCFTLGLALMSSGAAVAAAAPPCDMGLIAEPAELCSIPVQGGHFERGLAGWHTVGDVLAVTSPSDPLAAAASLGSHSALLQSIEIPASAHEYGDITLYQVVVSIHAAGEGGRVRVQGSMMDKTFNLRSVLDEEVELSPGVNTLPLSFSGVQTAQPTELQFSIHRRDSNASASVTALYVSAGQRGARID